MRDIYCFTINTLVLVSFSCEFVQSQTTLDDIVTDPSEIRTTTKISKVRDDKEKNQLLFNDDITVPCGAQLIPDVEIFEFNRITGERDATYGEFPWFTALQSKGRDGKYVYDCGGSVIGNRWILTAAHCYNHRDKTLPPDIAVLGAVNITADGNNTNITQNFYAPLASIIRHPLYKVENSPFGSNDIALLKTVDKIDLSGQNYPIVPVCLPAAGEEASLVLPNIIMGFGKEERDSIVRGNTIKSLKVNSISLFTHDECVNLTARSSHFDPVMICGGYAVEDPKGICDFDSGGPLVQFKKGRGTEFGVNALREYECGAIIGFTKVSSFIDWIFDTIESNQ